LQLERQPVKFIQIDLPGYEKATREALGKYLHCDPNDLAFVANATLGVNIAIRSLDLKPGDEILTCDQEYGACNNAWNFYCRKTGAVYVHHRLALPVQSMEQVADEIWKGVTPRTKVLYLSHITSPTALRLPVEELCRRAREKGIISIIDGAHAPGQIPLDLVAVGADFYTGNCHKWMLSPKGSAFLYVRPDMQKLVKPLIVSKPYEPEKPGETGHPMIDLFVWTGTRDPSAYLSIPASIEFLEKNNWEKVRADCHALLRQALERVCALTGLPPAYPLDSEFYSQMAIAPLPQFKDPDRFRQRLVDEFNVVVPITTWEDHTYARISVQAYTTPADIDALINALAKLLPEEAKEPVVLQPVK
jgi:isopenicillin-N epimerase